MNITGLQKTTLIDYPSQVACTVFTGGCNLRCGYCYNSQLVLNPKNWNKIPEKDFFDFLETRKKYLDGVVITGGEPTIHKDLIDFIKKIKEKGFLVKLDTNGTNPETIKKIIDQKLVNYIAMDVKASLEKYPEVTGSNISIEAIKKSIELIKNSGINHEFRTTVIAKYFQIQDAKQIGELIKGAKNYYLQQFKPTNSLIDPSLKEADVYRTEELKFFQALMEQYAENVGIRE